MINVPDEPVFKDIAEIPDHELASELPEPKRPPLSSELDPVPASKKVDICMIGAAPFNVLSKRRNCRVFAVSLHEIEEALKEKEEIDPRLIVPPEYHDLIDVFSKKDAKKLPLYRPYDHTVPIKPGKIAPFEALRGMSRDELLVL